MKSVPVIALMAAAIVVATLLHSAKNNRDTDDIDKIANGLKGIEKVLPEDANVFIQQYGIPGEYWLYCRYVLVPRNSVLFRTDLNGNRRVDTIIAITTKDATDSVLHVITDNRKVLWQHDDEQYKYYLTCNNR